VPYGRASLSVIAGPNGAGKTTFAREFLPHYADCKQFINADLVAQGMSPFSPDAAGFRAGRLMLGPQRLICSLLFSKCSARIPVDPRDSVKEGAPLRPWPYRVGMNACVESMSVVSFPASSETFQ
jgi:hypothetical protein